MAESPPNPGSSPPRYSTQDTPAASATDLPPGVQSIRQGVVGRVADARGRPVAGAFVQATGIGPHARPVPDLAVFTDSNGFYRWPLQPGDYEIMVTAEGISPASQRVTVLAGRPATLDFVAR